MYFIRFVFNRNGFFWLLLCLSSCFSLSKKEKEKHVISYPSLEKSTTSSLKLAFFEEGGWPSPNWWESFDDLDLSSLMTEALILNPTIQAVQQKVELAKQISVVKRSKLFPLIFFNYNETWEYISKNGLYRSLNPTISQGQNLIDLSLSFNYEFDFWGKYRNLYEAAIGQKKAEEAEYAQAVLITTTALAQTYFALKANLKKEKLYQKLLTVRKNTYDLQILLNKKALYSKLPPYLSQENLLETEKLLLGIREEIAINIHLINILRGISPDETVNASSLIRPLDKLSLPKTLSLNLLSRRPDLMAQIWRMEALAHEVGAAKADFFPSIDLVGLAGLESGFFHKLFKAGSITGGLIPAINLPIFTAGAISANVKAKKALFDQATFEYNDLILKSAQEVTDVLAFAESIFKQKQVQDNIVLAALERLELTKQRQISGLDNSLHVYSRQEEVILRELENVTLLYSQYAATIKLIKALGGGYFFDEKLPIEKEESLSP